MELHSRGWNGCVLFTSRTNVMQMSGMVNFNAISLLPGCNHTKNNGVVECLRC